MRVLIPIILLLAIWTCRSKNDDFNPFDNDFSFHNKMKVAEYDTIWDTCGYWSFEHDNNNGLRTYYGFLFDDLIVKGFSLEIDRESSPEICHD